MVNQIETETPKTTNADKAKRHFKSTFTELGKTLGTLGKSSTYLAEGAARTTASLFNAINTHNHNKEYPQDTKKRNNQFPEIKQSLGDAVKEAIRAVIPATKTVGNLTASGYYTVRHLGDKYKEYDNAA